MVWSEKYETGNEQVDNDHKEIFRLVQDVIDATFDNREQQIEITMDFLANYTLKHFQTEEALMEECGYPDITVHKKQHSDFVARFLELKDKIKDETDSLTSSLAVNNVIVNWLIDHVLDSDTIMAEFYKNWNNVYKHMDK